MSMIISRKLAGVNGLKDLLNEPLMPQESRTSIKTTEREKVDTGGAAFQLQQRDTDSLDAC